jgi:tetratricopeptide (TPR) repeat protein
MWPKASITWQDLYDSQGRYEQAEPLYVEALEMRKRLLGDEHPDVAKASITWQLYDSQGRYEQAEPLYQQALEMRKRLLGDEHPDVATSLNNLAGSTERRVAMSRPNPSTLKPGDESSGCWAMNIPMWPLASITWHALLFAGSL